MQGYRRYPNNRNQNDNNRRRNGKFPRYEKKSFPPPEQIPAFITTQNLYNLCQSFILNNDYINLNYVMEVLKIVRRAIMRIPCDNTYSIDVDMIHRIEDAPLITNQLPRFMVASQMLPTTNRNFDSESWTSIYRGMLPHRLNIVFNDESFAAFLNIFTNITLSEYSIQRDRLMNENKVLMNKALDRLDKSSPDYDKNCAEITLKYNNDFYKDYGKLKSENVWKYVDEYRDYFKTHDSSDLSDPTTVMIWSIITLNPIICGLDDYVSDIIKDVSILFIENVDSFDENIYWSLIKALRSKFFNEYPDYQNDICTKVMFEKWKIINKYSEILLKIIDFKNSERKITDIIHFDIVLCSILRDSQVVYQPFSTSSSLFYTQINLESIEGRKRIQINLNKLTESNVNEISKLLISLFDADNIIPICIESGARDKMSLSYAFLLKNIGSDKSDMIEKLIEDIKYKSEFYWGFYASLVYLSLIRNGQQLSEIISNLLSICKNDDEIMGCISSFVNERALNIELFQENKDMIAQLCEEYISKMRGMNKYKLMDSLNIIKKC